MAESPELRLALAMRGGVSLAVWMGGACSEVDRLRRALDGGSDGDAAVYRSVLEANGYGSVAVDVVAGASAGGLNSMLTACSVVHGMRFDNRIRDLWLSLGDIGALRRRSGPRPPVSLLDGDGGFFGALLPELRKLVEAGRAFAPAQAPRRLDAVLTCTLLTPVARTRYQDLGPAIVERRNRAWFRFRHLPGSGPDWTDFGRDAQEQDAALGRLAYAARSTSSFPGAFEPASVGAVSNSAAPLPPPTPPPTHYGTYSESRTAGDGPDRDLVIDGGVLDNIPVAWAIRSIAGAPADRPVERWLVYLQPLPFTPPGEGPNTLPDMVTTARRARDLQGGTEALADDLDELEDLQREVQRRRGFQQVLEYALGQVPSDDTRSEYLSTLFERALAAVPAYRLRAGEGEAARIRSLWIDPLPVFSADPMSFDGVTREPLANRPGPERLLRALTSAGGLLVLDAATPAVETTPEEQRAPQLASLLQRFRSPQVLARTVAVLLDAARELGEPGCPVKADLYRLRADIELLVAGADRALAAEPLQDLALGDAEEIARRAAWRPHEPDQGWPDHTSLWAQLVDQALTLAGLASSSDDVRAFVGCLIGAAADEAKARQATAAVLAAVEVLTGPLRPDPLAETGNIRFHMLSAQNQTLRRRDDGQPPTLDDLQVGAQGSVDDKLAGNQMANFGAFLSAQWRLNDWTWGRLDAARSLVEITTQQRPGGDDPLPALRARTGLANATLEQAQNALIRELHDQILRQELPLLAKLTHSPPSANLAPAPVPAGPPLDLTPLRRAGQARIRDLVRDDPSRALLLAQLGGAGAYSAAGSAVAPLTRSVGRTLGAAKERIRSVLGRLT